MARETSKRPKTASIPQTAVDQAGVFLQQLPEKPKEHLSLREAVDRMQDQIQTVLARGYSYEEVAQLLSKQGISISSSTLKNYVASGKRQSASDQLTPTKTRKRRTRQEQPEETSVPPVDFAAAEAVLASEVSLSEQPADQLNGSASQETSEPTPEKTTRKRGRASSTATQDKAAAANRETPARRGRRPSAEKTTTRTTTRGRKKADA